jgi:hypothetical protein
MPVVVLIGASLTFFRYVFPMLRSLQSRHSLLTGLTALVLACNYFAFQIELFEDEYEENHRLPSETSAIAGYSANLESIEKDNAPEALYFNAWLRIVCLFVLSPHPASLSVNECPLHPIRDKSPPHFSSLLLPVPIV